MFWRPDNTGVSPRYLVPAVVLAMLHLTGCHRPGSPTDEQAPGPPPFSESRAARRPVVGRYDPRTDPVTEVRLSRPLAVMIGNSTAARPQAGLDKARLVYEVLTEGGITRFLAIYPFDDAPLVGPIRSARPHFIQLAQPLGAVYVHCGQSPSAEVLLKREHIPEINELDGARPFWRDRARRAPHNLYASTASLSREAERHGSDRGSVSWPGLPESVVVNGELAGSVSIDYHRGTRYQVRYDYDRDRNVYLRSVNGKPHRDSVTGAQLSAGTVIVEQASTLDLGTDTGEQSIQVFGSGRCWFVRDGRWAPGRWFRQPALLGTRYEDVLGNPLGTGTGPTWVLIVPTSTSPTFKE